MLSGQRRIGKIDVHHHIFPPSEIYDKRGENARVGWRTPAENLPWTPEKSIEFMDTFGIEKAILSYPAGFPPSTGPDATKIVRNANMYASDLCKRHPSRFGFFASLPQPSDPEVLAELDYALDVLKADGIALSSSYGAGSSAKYVADETYDSLWQALDDRRATVFLHGCMTPSSTPYPHETLGLPVCEVPNETFKAAAHLVVTGKKRRYSNVTIILAHLGGCTPFLAPRVAVLSNHMGCQLSPEEIINDFKTFYYETALSAHESTLEMVMRSVGPERVLLGTDFPAVSERMINWYNEQLIEFLTPDEAVAAAVLRDNALRLLAQST
ncbi:amidohydrolase 2 [Punctularia strigosozonata HHB-11173 SS5]|uniref:amidohydrolase 2 n=1 Tax=Punctularia strigosozonata (strain HHB-11173) TaxID=741275 RepID=UPI00044163CC|nr:amidohydrolase 2 [Punctularia strigosozonata HHB-11173 SS5]EIN10452.1 amidohydrolase 2 [Punctularia strigosozonata HHB-11173 SS5]